MSEQTPEHLPPNWTALVDAHPDVNAAGPNEAETLRDLYGPPDGHGIYCGEVGQ